jgi:hypothetical protein
MQRSAIITIAVVGAIIFIVGIIAFAFFFFGRRTAPESMPIGAPSPSPQQIFGISLPTGSFFRSRPVAEQLPVGMPPSSPAPTPSSPVLQIPALLPSPIVTSFRLSPSWEQKIKELKAEGRTAFTKEELFELQWPADYREKLSYLQDLAIQQGLIPTSSRKDFKSQEEIIEFLVSALPAAVKIGIITQQDAARFENAIKNDLIAAKEKESAILYSRLIQSANPHSEHISAMSPSGFRPADSPPTFLGAVADLLKNFLYPKPASGQIGIDCAQEITYTPNWLGPLFWAPCCNCFAFKFPIGCLNYFCFGRSALWDSVTGICGCDI